VFWTLPVHYKQNIGACGAFGMFVSDVLFVVAHPAMFSSAWSGQVRTE
jgi:hypothetical protein